MIRYMNCGFLLLVAIAVLKDTNVLESVTRS